MPFAVATGPTGCSSCSSFRRWPRGAQPHPEGSSTPFNEGTDTEGCRGGWPRKRHSPAAHVGYRAQLLAQASCWPVLGQRAVAGAVSCRRTRRHGMDMLTPPNAEVLRIDSEARPHELSWRLHDQQSTAVSERCRRAHPARVHRTRGRGRGRRLRRVRRTCLGPATLRQHAVHARVRLEVPGTRAEVTGDGPAAGAGHRCSSSEIQGRQDQGRAHRSGASDQGAAAGQQRHRPGFVF